MDFERATLRALFYDYPIETAVKVIKDSRDIAKRDVFMDILPQLVRWRETSFTTTEARLLQNSAMHNWLALDKYKEDTNTKEVNTEDGNTIPYVCRPFLLVKHMAKQLLDFGGDTSMQPILRFENLFRWKDATMYVGEDLFTTALFAAKDAEELYEKTHLFAWPDTIAHDDADINRVLDRGVTDTHAHYYATADVFHLNWMNITNCLNFDREKWFSDNSCFQDVALSTLGTETIYPYHRLCIAVAWLRLCLFQIFILGSKPDFDENNKQNKEKYKCSWNLPTVFDILENDFIARSLCRDINSMAAAYRIWALHTPEGHAFDYALMEDPVTNSNRDNIFIIHHGERRLMYRFFLRYFQWDSLAWQMAPYFYLYILLKNRIRSEFVQINNLKGFENFETYQNKKNLFIPDSDPIWIDYDKFALQSSVRLGHRDFLEARINPKNLSVVEHNFGRSVFSTRNVIPAVGQKLSFVVHFIKENYSRANTIADIQRRQKIQTRRERHFADGFERYFDFRRELKTDINRVLHVVEAQRNYPAWDSRIRMPRIVGIDAASTEMFCRPEVFGHVFRFAKIKGMHNRTYHVGEDFFDITDGLRAIDEAVTFLELDGSCRIGHALAIGINPESYYLSRRLRILQPAQYILDNCVWICMRAAEANIDIPNSLENYLVRLAQKMYEHIGYQNVSPFNIYTYWNSMLLRGDEPDGYYGNDLSQHMRPPVSDWERTAFVHDERIDEAREDKKAKWIYSCYQYLETIKKKGADRKESKFPPEIIPVVRQLQQWLLRELAKRHITIECNPTSNLKIGFFERYDQHPLLTTFDALSQLGETSYPSVSATVCTDNRGVFCTTAYTELSLMALAMRKIKDENNNELYNERTILDYIERIRTNGYNQRFILKQE